MTGILNISSPLRGEAGWGVLFDLGGAPAAVRVGEGVS